MPDEKNHRNIPIIVIDVPLLMTYLMRHAHSLPQGGLTGYREPQQSFRTTLFPIEISFDYICFLKVLSLKYSMFCTILTFLQLFSVTTLIFRDYNVLLNSMLMLNIP